MKRFLLAVFLAFATVGAYYAVKLGAFANIEMSIENKGPFYVVYKEHLGPYHLIGPTIDEIQKAFLSHNMRCEGFGEFFDDPSKVEHIRLRSNAGCIFTSPVDISEFGFGPDVKTKTIESHLFIVANFSGSPAFGPYKVYSKIGDRLVEEKMTLDGPTIEIYHDLPTGLVNTEYLFPVKR